MDLDSLYLINDILGTGVLTFALTFLFTFFLIRLILLLIRQ